MRIIRNHSFLLAAILACAASIVLRPLFSPTPTRASGIVDPITIVCNACTLGTNLSPQYLILRDEATGQMWAYPRLTQNLGTINFQATPVLVGTLTPGHPVQ
jgi:hypothetical protein